MRAIQHPVAVSDADINAAISGVIRLCAHLCWLYTPSCSFFSIGSRRWRAILDRMRKKFRNLSDDLRQSALKRHAEPRARGRATNGEAREGRINDGAITPGVYFSIGGVGPRKGRMRAPMETAESYTRSR